MKRIIMSVFLGIFVILSACQNQTSKEVKNIPTTSLTPSSSGSPIHTPVPSNDESEKVTNVGTGTILEGEIQGAKYKVHVPKSWKGKILIYAHGLTNAADPLIANLSTDSPDHINMIEDGWILASTSYRRNGYILKDAFEDINNLKEFIENKYGKSRISIVQGYSMGGMIATRMAECGYDFSGFLAIGAVTDYTIEWTPKKPVLFLSNMDEIDYPLKYQKNVKENWVKPAVWKVSRYGHCEVNGKEVSAAIDALIKWIEKGKVLYENDGTIDYDHKSSAFFENNSASAKIININEEEYNMDTKFIKEDLETLSIKNGDYFSLTFNNDIKFNVLYGKHYTDVGYGEFVGYINAYGYLRIARNFKSIVGSTDCVVGDILTIKK